MGVPVTDYVLVHGAWCGSWIWKRVRDRLAAAGHRVFTPTLTGLGERSHLLDRRLGVQTHIDDVANLLVWEDLRDVVLVGHSYAGFVVRHIADRMPERLRSLVYLDAFVPENGKRIRITCPTSNSGRSPRPMARGGRCRRSPRRHSASMPRISPGWIVKSPCIRCPPWRRRRA